LGLRTINLTTIRLELISRQCYKYCSLYTPLRTNILLLGFERGSIPILGNVFHISYAVFLACCGLVERNRAHLSNLIVTLQAAATFLDGTRYVKPMQFYVLDYHKEMKRSNEEIIEVVKSPQPYRTGRWYSPNFVPSRKKVAEERCTVCNILHTKIFCIIRIKSEYGKAINIFFHEIFLHRSIRC